MKKRLNLSYSFIFSLAIHLSLAYGTGAWLVSHVNNIKPGTDSEQVLILEVGWREAKTVESSSKSSVIETKKDDKRNIKIKEEIEIKEKKKPRQKKEGQKESIKPIKKTLPKINAGFNQKEGRSGKQRVTLSGGNNPYLEKVRSQIEKAKFYPLKAKIAKLEGEVTAEFQIDKQGDIQNIVLVGPSKHRVLNTAALKILTKASPFPKPTDDSVIDKTIETTLVFNLTY